MRILHPTGAQGAGKIAEVFPHMASPHRATFFPPRHSLGHAPASLPTPGSSLLSRFSSRSFSPYHRNKKATQWVAYVLFDFGTSDFLCGLVFDVPITAIPCDVGDHGDFRAHFWPQAEFA
jgi:hypothetical protein